MFVDSKKCLDQKQNSKMERNKNFQNKNNLNNLSKIENKLNIKLINKITANYWFLFEDIKGLSIQINNNSNNKSGSILNYLRLNYNNQNLLKEDIINYIIIIIKQINNLINKKLKENYYKKWKIFWNNNKPRTLNYYFSYKTKVRYLFIVWKELTKMNKFNRKCQKQACIRIISLLMYSTRQKVSRYFNKWSNYNKYLHRILFKSFEYWSIWTLQSKLRKCNILKFCKIFFSTTGNQAPKRIRWYFENWKKKTDLIGKYLLIKNTFLR